MYRKLHQQENRFRGVSTAKHIPDIKKLIDETHAKTLLDFGCGKGIQYNEHKIHLQWGGVKPTLYDPGYRAHDQKPEGTWDGVICTDVLEHIPRDSVKDVLFDIISRADKFVFLNVSTRPAGVNLPNGENAHCTVEEHSWWEKQIKNVKTDIGSDVIIFLESRKNLEDEIISSII